MTEEDLSFVTNSDLLNIIMSCEYEIEDYAEALAHVCFGDKKLTKVLCKNTLNVIQQSSDQTRSSNYLKLVHS